MKFRSGEDTLAVLDGFTVQGVFHFNGAISMVNSSGRIRNCRFVGNQNPDPGYQSSWGAIAFNGGAYLIAEDNYFEGNRSYSSAGIGMWCGTGRIVENTFVNNEAFGDFGGAIGVGGPCGSAHLIEGNLFVGNTSPVAGALFISENTGTIIKNNTFISNSSSMNDGGAICIWYYNTGIIIEDNVMVGNSGYGIANIHGSTMSLDCNDAFNNTPSNYSAGCDAGPHSFSADPLFCSTGMNSYSLEESSPCAPANNSCGELILWAADALVCPVLFPEFIIPPTTDNLYLS
ncbi:MAG: right-handed parallel beta-helix repeat-containing protein [Sedimentisphaerales bacterium]|nr:right-handed parallel beta-helix repeat-containing protein [Sedimentisphaerales bacterium]